MYIFSIHGSNNNSFHINAIITTPEKNKLIETQPLVDFGTGEIFMDQNYARKQGFNLTKLEYPIMGHGTKCGRNRKYTRNYPILYGSRFTRQRQKAYGTIPYYWIGKPKSHFGITLVVKA
jgi:hypothetical protein